MPNEGKDKVKKAMAAHGKGPQKTADRLNAALTAMIANIRTIPGLTPEHEAALAQFESEQAEFVSDVVNGV